MIRAVIANSPNRDSRLRSVLRGIIELNGSRENADRKGFTTSSVQVSAVRKATIVTTQATGEINASEGSRGAERRLERRFDCNGFAEVYAFEAGLLFRGTIRDISQTGCYILTKFGLKLEPLTEVDVLLILKNYEYRIPALVRNVRPGRGVGLEFLYRDPQIEARFHDLLQKFLEKEPPAQT